MIEIEWTEEQQEALKRALERLVKIVQEVLERMRAACLAIQEAFQAWIHPVFRWWIMIQPAYLEWRAQRYMEYWWICSAQRQWIVSE